MTRPLSARRAANGPALDRKRQSKRRPDNPGYSGRGLPMFNVNGWELAIILVLALILFGPDRLPQVAAQAGRWLHHFQRLAAEATDDLAREFRAAAAEVDSAQGELQALERLVAAATDPRGQLSERAGESVAQSHEGGPATEAAWPPPRPPSS